MDYNGGASNTMVMGTSETCTRIDGSGDCIGDVLAGLRADIDSVNTTVNNLGLGGGATTTSTGASTLLDGSSAVRGQIMRHDLGRYLRARHCLR